MRIRAVQQLSLNLTWQAVKAQQGLHTPCHWAKVVCFGIL